MTDASLRTSDPAIYAAGDIASAFHPLLGRHIRVEHWANALHQPETAATAMLGRDAAYDRVPSTPTSTTWAWNTPATPAPGGYDRVVFRGDVAEREFIAFWLSGGRVAAGMNVNIWDVNDTIQALIRSGPPVDPARLADPAVPAGEAFPGRRQRAEDHYPQGGLAAAVLEALAGTGLPLRARQCALSRLPGFGTSDELMEAPGISASRIAAAARG